MSPTVPPASTRVDKWLWATRVFHTRSQATAACRAGHVKIEGQNVKPARPVRPGEIITAQVGELTRTVRVLGPLRQRVGAQAARAFLQDLTPATEYQKRREPAAAPVLPRPRGSGRPTKKERRALDNLSF
jgi:ribosome-associated heat shock protein Hsp15